MTAIANGLFAYGGLRPFVATFLNFVGYALGAVRLSALSHFGVFFVMTHDRYGQLGLSQEKLELGLEACGFSRHFPSLVWTGHETRCI
jgi:transketolase